MGSFSDGDTVSRMLASGAALAWKALVIGEMSWLGGGFGGGPDGRMGFEVAMLAGRRLRLAWPLPAAVFDSRLSSLLETFGLGSAGVDGGD